MAESIKRVEPYSALAAVYQAAGFASYTADLAPRLLELAFEMEWTGRSLLDLACGTGDLACWFSEHSFRVIGVDSSPNMLKYGTARANDTGTGVEFVVADMRTYKPNYKFDMVTCLGGSLNYIPTLKEMETIFRTVHAALEPGKLFVFDVQTIQGLARHHNSDRIVYDDGKEIMIVTRDSFNFETLQLSTRYIILNEQGPGSWERAEETHMLRSVPVRTVTQTLENVGFKVVRTLRRDLSNAEGHTDLDQVLIVAARR